MNYNNENNNLESVNNGKKRTKVYIIIALVLTGVLLLSLTLKIFKPKKNEPKVCKSISEITLVKETIELDEGDTFKLFNSSYDSSNDCYKDLRVSLSNDNITYKNNTIKGIKEGETIITINYQNDSYTYKVKVNKPKPGEIKVETVTLDKSNAEIKTGESVTFNATVSPNEATNKTITWSSSNNNIATVENGVVKGINPGTVTITATSVNRKKATAKVKVNPINDIKVENVTLDKNSAEIKTGDSVTFNATVHPNEAANKIINWSSSNNNIATVNNGVVKGINPGTVTITATSVNGKKATATVKVNKRILVTEITLNKTSANIHIDESVTLTATIKPSNAENKGITWTSSDNNIATVNNGVVTGKKAGNVTITASANNGVKASAKITVAETKVSSKIGNQVKYYKTITEAITEAKTNQATIKLYVDFNEIITIKENQNIILDANGHKLSSDSKDKYLITILGNAKFQFSNGTLYSKNYVTVSNKGTFTMNGGTITSDNSNKKVTFNNASTGTLTINNGTIYSKNSSAINNYGTLSIGNGQIKSDATRTDPPPTIYIYKNAKATINNGTIYSKNSNAINNYGTLNITNGQIKSDSSEYPTIFIAENAKATVSGGNVSSTNQKALDNDGTLIINGGTITSDNSNNKYTLYNSSTGTATITNGTIYSKNSNALYNDGTFTMNGGTITSDNSNSKVTLYNSNTGTTTINNGNIYSKNSNAIRTAGTLNISGGQIKSDTNGNSTVYIDKDVKVSMRGGTIIAPSSWALSNEGTFTMNGGTITSENLNERSTLRNYTTGTVIINNGTIYSKNCVGIRSEGTLNISGGQIKSDAKESGTVYIDENAKVTMSGGTISSTNYVAFCNLGIFTMNGGTITSDNSNKNETFDNYSTGTATITNGTIYSKNANAVRNFGKLNIGSSSSIGAGTPMIQTDASYNAVCCDTKCNVYSGTFKRKGTNTGVYNATYPNGYTLKNTNITGDLYTWMVTKQ